MKVFYWSPFFAQIATAKAVTRSALSLKKYSNKYEDVRLIDAINEWEFFENKNVKVAKLNNLNLKKWLPKNGFIKSRFSYLLIFMVNFMKLKKYLNQEKPDYLIIHLLTSLPIFLSPFINKKTKIILRISGYPKINFMRFYFWKLYSKNIYKITCPTRKTYEYILKKKIFKQEQLEILYDPALEIKDFIVKKNEKVLENIFKDDFIISIGRFTHQKNFKLLINFFNEICVDEKNINLVILGDGEKFDELKKLSMKLKIDNKIHFLGYKKNVFKYLKKAKCFISTSLWEDPGFVLTEAAISNIPIISSDCPNGPKEILNENGFLFKNNNLYAMIEAYKKFSKMKQIDIRKKVFFLKKSMKRFTLFHHYKKLNLILK